MVACASHVSVGAGVPTVLVTAATNAKQDITRVLSAGHPAARVQAAVFRTTARGWSAWTVPLGSIRKAWVKPAVVNANRVPMRMHTRPQIHTHKHTHTQVPTAPPLQPQSAQRKCNANTVP